MGVAKTRASDSVSWVDNIVQDPTVGPDATGNRQPAQRPLLGPLAEFPSRSRAARRDEAGPHDCTALPALVHMHDMWGRPTRSQLSTGRNFDYRASLSSAYLTMVDGKSESHANANLEVDAHLWTDEKNLYKLLRPVVKSNGSEVEIPHSMLARGPVSVHFKGEMDAMIGSLKSKDEDNSTVLKQKRALMDLHTHPVTENIGARADINRALYTFLHKQRPGDNYSELNVHIDIDTINATRLQKYSQGEKKEVVQSSEIDNLANEKMRLMAMKTQLDHLTLPNAPTPLTAEETARLAAQPQRPWSPLTSSSSPNNPMRQTGSPSVQANVERLGKLGFSPHVGSDLPDGSGTIENDFLVVRPLSREAGNVLSDIAENLKITENFTRDNVSIADRFAILARRNALDLMSLNGSDWPEKEINHSTLVDYFILAEKIRKAKPVIDEKMKTLRDRVDQSADRSEARENAESELQALQYIYATSVKLVENFVNHTTFVPQGRRDGSGEYSAMQKAVHELTTESLFGADVPQTSTGSWASGGHLEKTNLWPDDEMPRKVFREVKAMLRTPTMEDLY
jgi:hypothetical protein